MSKKIYNTTYLDGKAHGGTVIFIKERVEKYELLKYEEGSSQAT
jgi:hypothetical protein